MNLFQQTSKTYINYIIRRKNSKQFRLTKRGNNVTVFNKINPNPQNNNVQNLNHINNINDEEINLDE